MILKDRHRHLDSRAQKPGSTKVEDVKRHVWKVSVHLAFADGRNQAYQTILLCLPIYLLGDHRMLQLLLF